MAGDRRGVRHGVLGAVTLIMVGILGTRLWFLQVVDSQGIAERVEIVTTRSVDIPPERGRIFDADGRILADNKRVLTVTVDQDVLRSSTKKRKQLWERLAGPLGTTSELLEKKYENNPDSPVLPFAAATDVEEPTALYLLERVEDFPGVDVRTDWERLYPYAPIASHILGFMGRVPSDDPKTTDVDEKAQYLDNGYSLNDKVGATGVEKSFENDLRGTPGHAVYKVDNIGRVLETLSYVPATAGRDVQLTIDLDVQQFAEQALETELKLRRLANPYERDTENPLRFDPSKNFKAPAGSVVVEQHGTGRIIAMASYPTFDNRWFNAGVSSEKFAQLFPPEDKTIKYDDRPPSPLVNRAIQGRYNVGSTFKPFTAYAAVHHVMENDGQTFIADPLNDTYDDKGTYTIDPTICNKADGVKCEFRNAKNFALGGIPTTYGTIKLADALAVSSDTYFYRIGAEMFLDSGKLPVLQEELKLFGFGEKTGIDLPYEYRGIIPDKATKARLAEQGAISDDEGAGFFVGDSVQMAIGQGLVAVTPLQLTNAYATLANGGLVFKPQIARAVFEPGVKDAESPGFANVFGGTVHKDYYPDPVRRLDMLPEKVAPIYEGLHRVINGPGSPGHDTTARKVFKNYAIQALLSGKTGTAQGRESLPENDSSVFAAFEEKPDGYTIAAYIEKAGYGSQAAAPLARCIFQMLEGQVQANPVEISAPRDVNSPYAAPPNPLSNTDCLKGDTTVVTGER